MAKVSDKAEQLSLAELGLEEEGAKAPSEPVSTGVEKAQTAMEAAAATAALKAAISANSEMAQREAEKTYIIEKKKFMLDKCKTDSVRKFVGQKIFANYFGPVYTFLFNGIPVTVKFDGSTQEFPEFIYNKIMEMISEVSESNTNKVEIEDRTK